VAKVDASAEAFSRRDVIRARGLFQIKSWKGKPYVSAWPKRRGPNKTPLQQAWVNHFKCVARFLKAPPPRILDAATDFAAGTGWYYRDVMEVAAVAKLIRYNEEKPVTTPTCMLHRSTAQNQSGSTPYLLTPDSAEWDNNGFWNGSLNPSRISFKAPGLYFVGSETQFPNGSSGNPVPFIRKNGTQTLTRSYTGASGSFQTFPLLTLYYFHANDYIEALVDISGSGHNFLLLNFFALAMTPEAILP